MISPFPWMMRHGYLNLENLILKRIVPRLLVSIGKNEIHHIKESFNKSHTHSMDNKLIIQKFLDIKIIMSKSCWCHHWIDVNFLRREESIFSLIINVAHYLKMISKEFNKPFFEPRYSSFFS